MLKFYRWLIRYAQEKVKNHVYVNIKCPHCRTWSSSVKGNSIDRDWGYKWQCGQCLRDSHWNTTIAPIPILCDEKGYPNE
jgi:hypothetical protein